MKSFVAPPTSSRRIVFKPRSKRQLPLSPTQSEAAESVGPARRRSSMGMSDPDLRRRLKSNESMRQMEEME